MQGCLNFAKTLRAGAVFVGLISFGITTVMAAAPAAVRNKTVPTKVEIFTTDAFPITGVEELKRLVGEKNVTVYALDGVDKVEKQYEFMPASNDQNTAVIARKTLSANRADIAPRVFGTYRGLIRAAFAYDIKKFPAIVFDQKFVAYGERDASQALKTLRNSADYRRNP